MDRLGVEQGGRFTREDKLHLRREFDAVYARGRRFAGRSFILFLLPNGLGHSRLGVTVSRKVGGAVVRNRARRRLREIFRTHRAVMGGSFDVVLHARSGIAAASFEALREEYLAGLVRVRAGLRSGR